MVLDRITRWFIEHIIIPRTSQIDIPGFIIVKFNVEDKQIILRDIFLPENLLANIEVEIVKNFGEKGRKVLYTIGKTFG